MLFCVSSCGVLKKQVTPESQIVAISTEPLPPEKTKAILKDVSQNWVYGDGIGKSIFHVGATIAFPPYALALLGNTAISLSGYQPLGVSYFLNEEQKPGWDSFHSNLFSGPGRLISALSGEEYRTPEIAKQKLLENLKIDNQIALSLNGADGSL